MKVWMQYYILTDIDIEDMPDYLDSDAMDVWNDRLGQILDQEIDKTCEAMAAVESVVDIEYRGWDFY